MQLATFQSQVKAIYNGKIKWRQDSINYYAWLTGRKVRYHRESGNWTVEIYVDGQYVCLGFGDSCLEAETKASENYEWNQKWNRRPYPKIKLVPVRVVCTNKLTAKLTAN